MEPTTVTDALKDDQWILAMQEGLLQFERNQGSEFLIIQIYVNDIIFGGISSACVENFISQMNAEFEMRVCARYQADSRMLHLHSTKRILKNIIGTVDYGLWYTFDTTVVLIWYCDADKAECSDDQVEYIAAGSNCSKLQSAGSVIPKN
ncbi:putative mitochondrial protein [Cucumis melo var. makuwa]|uniref:Putative mitochondrial protein n=1 Tax=Cucumis melo var. makuwa TaxID=1194695 RepID=A0A5D3CWT4_CUCMM|nr:putative mitochondrial protein [Cucumis melo var. makuwa]